MTAPPRILIAVRSSPSSNTPEATPTRFIRYWYTKARLAPTPEMPHCHAQKPEGGNQHRRVCERHPRSRSHLTPVRTPEPRHSNGHGGKPRKEHREGGDHQRRVPPQQRQGEHGVGAPAHGGHHHQQIAEEARLAPS